MAGKRQHHITVHLMKGFGFPRGGVATMTHLYRKGDSQRRVVSIRDVATRKHFYSKDHAGSLDEKITDYENNLLRSNVDLLRGARPYGTVPPDCAAEVVTHFAIRGAFIREHLADCVDRLLREIQNEPHSVPLAPRDIGRALSDRLHQVFPRFRIPPALCTFAVSLLLQTAAGKAALSKAYATTMDQFASLPIDNVAKYAHKKALDDIMSNPSGEISMRNALKGLSWRVFPYSNAILPDCVSVAFESGSWRQSTIWTNSPETVVFPLNAETICVGTQTGERGALLPTHLHAYNEVAARLSDSFFIAKSKTPARLHLSIGEDSHRLARDLVRGFISRQRTTWLG